LVIISAIIAVSCSNNKSEQGKTTGNQSKTTDLISVKVEKVHPQTFVHYLEITGTADAVKWAFISPQINGQVKKINVNDGDYVKKGDVLVELNDAIIRNNIAEVEAQLDLATTTYEKQKSLYESQVVSEIAYLQAKAQKESLEKRLANLQEQLSFTKVTAPFDGVIENLMIKEGEIAAPGRQLMQIYNLSEMKILADIPETYISRIKKGDTVIVNFDDINFENKKIPVYRVGNVIDPNNRTFKIELRLRNEKAQIKPNMVARLKVKDYENPNAFILPAPLVKKDFDKEFLFIAERKNNTAVAKKVYVTTNMTYNGNMEITGGLHDNDEVIIEGYNDVADNSPVKILN